MPSIGLVIEGGVNTEQPLPRIISIHPDGAAFHNGVLKVGQIIQEVDGIKLQGELVVLQRISSNDIVNVWSPKVNC